MNRTLSKISLIAVAGAAMFMGGCATHREVVAAPPPAETYQSQTTTSDQMAQPAPVAEPAHRGPRG